MQHKLPRAFYFILFLVLVAGNISVYSAIFAPRMLTVNILDVGPPAGGGHVTLIQTSTRKTILIDTGADASILRALGESLPVWQRDIDVVILTSSAARFAGGLSAVEARYHISKLIHIGDSTTPYGSSLTLSDSIIKILAPATFSISSGSAIFKISSSTPAGVYNFN